MVDIVCKGRKISIDEATFGAILFLGAAMFNGIDMSNIYEQWLDGADVIEVNDEMFLTIMMLNGMVATGIKIER